MVSVTASSVLLAQEFWRLYPCWECVSWCRHAFQWICWTECSIGLNGIFEAIFICEGVPFLGVKKLSIVSEHFNGCSFKDKQLNHVANDSTCSGRGKLKIGRDIWINNLRLVGTCFYPIPWNLHPLLSGVLANYVDYKHSTGRVDRKIM